MLIKPGTHTLKVRYWIEDVATHVEGTITKTLSAFNYAKNTYYDMTADLKVTVYDGDNYYMWDAQKQYWDGWEWTKNLTNGQPVLLAKKSTNFAKNNTDQRWYREGSGYSFDATASCAIAPNVNEMLWYARKGDPRWDADELWSTMGHLYKGGMWFKKKAYISGFNDNTSPDGTDWRNNGTQGGTWAASNILPSASEASKYFYLPVLGRYDNGYFNDIGVHGRYWSRSTKYGNAYCLSFRQGFVSVNYENRKYGHRIQAFE